MNEGTEIDRRALLGLATTIYQMPRRPHAYPYTLDNQVSFFSLVHDAQKGPPRADVQPSVMLLLYRKILAIASALPGSQ